MSDYQFPAADVDTALKELFEPEDSGFLLQPVRRALHAGTATLRAERKDMLAALQGLVGLIELIAPTLDEPQRFGVEGNHRLLAARAAIAKATAP